MRDLIPYGFRRGILDLFREIDNLCEELSLDRKGFYSIPRTDVKETGKEYIIKMDMPGLDKDKIDVDLEDSVLKVKATRESGEKEEKDNYLRFERTFTGYQRSFTIPQNASNEVKATYKDGVLELRIDKIKKIETETKKIKVQ